MCCNDNHISLHEENKKGIMKVKDMHNFKVDVMKCVLKCITKDKNIL